MTVQGAPADPSALAGFLEAHPAEVGSPDELFLLDTLDLKDGPDQSVLLSIKANPDAPADLAELVPFWKGTQSYTFVRVGDTWKLSKVEGN